jgi:PAS domain S-box-containing protein
MPDPENAQMTEELEKERRARKQSEERFRSIIEKNADGILVVDREGTVRFANKAAEALLGRSAEDLLGAPFGFPIAAGRMTEIDLVRINGETAVAEMHVTPSEWEGEPVYLATLRDITEKKQAEQELKRHALALAERNKELNCLYGISRLVENPENSLEDILKGTVSLLPPALQYPDIAAARIILEGRVYASPQFRETPWRQGRDILLYGRKAGWIEVVYLEEKPPLDEGPFLAEERYLIDAVAERMGHIIERVRAEAQLLQSEQKFRDIFNSSSDAIFIHDMTGRFLEVNEAACRRLGYRRDELLAMTPKDIDAHGYDELVSERMQIVRERGELVFESAHYRKDGSTLPVEISSRSIEFEGRASILSIARDITERLEKETEYAQILNTSIDGFWVVDSRGRLLDANPAAAEMLGYTRNEMLSLRLSDIDADESPEQTKNRLQALRERGYARFETRHRHKSGRLIDVEVSASYVGHQKKIVVAFTRDITERKKAEKALRDSEERLSRTIEGTRAGIWDWYVQTGEAEFNERWAEIIGYTLEELSPVSIETWTRFAHPEDLKRSELLLHRHFTGELEYYECECRMRHKQGYWVWVQDRGKVIEWDSQGRPWRMTGTHIDVTRQKKLEQEQRHMEYRLQQSEKAESLSRMAGAVAHHFNNQLGSILGYLELALEDLPPISEVRENLMEAVQAGRKAAGISRQMLAYLGQSAGEGERLDLSEACRQALARLGPAELQGSLPDPELIEPGPVVHANPDELEKILRILILNAREAMEDAPGRILVRTRVCSISELKNRRFFPVDWQPSHAAYACLEVEDAGCGIALEDMDKIFDPFFTTRFTGRGLGLPMLLGMVKAKGGAVAVWSVPGRGTSVRVLMPLEEEVLQTPARDSGEAPKPRTSGTVLAVEDQQEVLRMLKTMIERAGYNAIAVQSGQEAVSLIRERPGAVDCVITDLSMPGMDGWETTAAIKAVSPEIPVILASGHDTAGLENQSKDRLPDGYLQKPYQMSGLRSVIKQVLQQGTRAGAVG